MDLCFVPTLPLVLPPTLLQRIAFFISSPRCLCDNRCTRALQRARGMPWQWQCWMRLPMMWWGRWQSARKKHGPERFVRCLTNSCTNYLPLTYGRSGDKCFSENTSFNKGILNKMLWHAALPCSSTLHKHHSPYESRRFCSSHTTAPLHQHENHHNSMVFEGACGNGMAGLRTIVELSSDSISRSTFISAIQDNKDKNLCAIHAG